MQSQCIRICCTLHFCCQYLFCSVPYPTRIQYWFKIPDQPILFTPLQRPRRRLLRGRKRIRKHQRHISTSYTTTTIAEFDGDEGVVVDYHDFDGRVGGWGGV